MCNWINFPSNQSACVNQCVQVHCMYPPMITLVCDGVHGDAFTECRCFVCVCVCVCVCLGGTCRCTCGSTFVSGLSPPRNSSAFVVLTISHWNHTTTLKLLNSWLSDCQQKKCLFMLTKSSLCSCSSPFSWKHSSIVWSDAFHWHTVQEYWKGSTVSLKTHSSTHYKQSPVHIKIEWRQDQMFCSALRFCC